MAAHRRTVYGLRGRRDWQAAGQRAWPALGFDRGRTGWRAAALAAALRIGRFAWPGMGHSLSQRAGRGRVPGAAARRARTAGVLAAASHRLPVRASPGSGRYAGSRARTSDDRTVSARATDARVGNAAATTAAGRRRGPGQDHPGGADRHRTDRAPAGAPDSGGVARRVRC